jgi:hypothetical protein
LERKPNGTLLTSFTLQYPAAPIGITVTPSGSVFTGWAGAAAQAPAGV